MEKLILILTFAFGLTAASGQTVGLKISPNISMTDATPDPGIGFSGGVYLDHPVYKKLGLSTGVYFTQLRAARMSPNCFYFGFDEKPPCPDWADHRFDILEIPLDMALDLTMQPEKKLRFFLTVGYSYGQIISKKEFSYLDGKKTSEELTSLPGLVKQLNFFKLGPEARYSLSDNINMGMGVQYKSTNIYNIVYGSFHNFNVFVKSGYNF